MSRIYPRNTPQAIADRLIERPDTGCLMYPCKPDRFGYRYASINGSKRVVHKVLWEAFRGPVPDGLELDHTCEVSGCANLNHLEPVTPSINCQRRFTRNGYTAGTQLPENGAGGMKRYCVENHPADCWYTRPNGNGKGYCNRSAWRQRKAA